MVASKPPMASPPFFPSCIGTSVNVCIFLIRHWLKMIMKREEKITFLISYCVLPTANRMYSSYLACNEMCICNSDISL